MGDSKPVSAWMGRPVQAVLLVAIVAILVAVPWYIVAVQRESRVVAVMQRVEQLEPGDLEAEIAVTSDLVELGDDAVPSLIAGLQHPDPHVRRCCANALSNLEPEDLRSGRDLEPALIRATRDEDPMVRWASAESLSKMFPRSRKAAEAAVPALIASIDPESSMWAGNASMAASLGRFGPLAKDAVPVLEGLLEHEDTRISAAAAAALGKIGGDEQ